MGASDLSGVKTNAVSQIMRATCMAGDCAFNLLAFQGPNTGMRVRDLQEGIRIHVQLSGHRVYVHDERGIIVGPTEQP